MERQNLSYGVVVSTRGLRVQALLGGSNSPTSRSPEAVNWIMCVWITGVRTLYTEEGGGLYRVRQTPPALSCAGFQIHYGRALLVTPQIKCYDEHKSYLMTDHLRAG